MNKYLRTIVIAPITSSSKAYVTRIEIKQNKTKGWVVIDQIRTIDRTRIIKTFSSLSQEDIVQVKAVNKKLLGRILGGFVLGFCGTI